MGLKEQVLVAAEQVLKDTPEGMTAEALARQVAKAVGRQLPEKQVANALREAPHRFFEGSDGRWRFREISVLTPEDEDGLPEPGATIKRARPKLKHGCFVVFDIEATGQGPESPDTEILQIAAQRWVDGKPQEPWMSFARPMSGEVPAVVANLTHITTEDVANAPDVSHTLQSFLNYVGDLPLIAHNGASYDGPLIRATCQRLGIPLPETFVVLDTLPLARVLLPTAESHRVGTLAEHFGCARPDAHRADADVDMLSGIIQGLQTEIQSGATGAAVYELLKRADDPWADILAPPASQIQLTDIVARFGANIIPPLPDPAPVLDTVLLDDAAVENVFSQTESMGRSRRPPQVQMAKFVASILRDSGYGAVEAGTGTGKSMGYLLPAALASRITGEQVAVSTYTRVLQMQLVERELPFVQQIFPELTYAQLQGRGNYLSLQRLAEEVEDALAEDFIQPSRAWMLGTLIRFAEISAQGNLEEMGYTPMALDEYLDTDGAVLQVLNSVRASEDDGRAHAGVPDFYTRARENADKADILVINHALLLTRFLRSTSNGPETVQEPFVGNVICDEAHTLEDAATNALEQRVEEQQLRRLLREIYNRGRSGLVVDCRRRLGMAREDESLQALSRAVEDAQAALTSLADRLRQYVASQVVVSQEEMARYGVRVRIDAGALSAAGGPALRTAEETMRAALRNVKNALDQVISAASSALSTVSGGAPDRRARRVVQVAKSLRREIREIEEQYIGFWSFRDASSTVRMVELGRIEADESTGRRTTAPVAISAVPINVGPLLWQHVWSRLDSAIHTSATITVSGQGFDFFLSRIGLEPARVQLEAPDKTVSTLELPHAFNYHDNALLMLPNDLPAPRDTALKREFPEAVADLLRRFIPFFDGRTLVLFTANSRRDKVYDNIAEPLARYGYPVLCQGQGGMQRLVEEFRELPERSLLGSRSFWEGVDVPGESLSYVFLEKLPYPSIGDPVEAARMSAVEASGRDPFYQYLLPKMVILFKQGFGRLIRTETDRGAAVLLDKRLRNAMYRAEVLRSLPDPTVGYESDVELFRRIAEWMGIDFSPEDLPAPTVSNLAKVLAEQQLEGLFVPEEEFETVAKPRLLAVQKAIWGQDSFREGQEEIIRSILSGKDHLTLLPTGAGKSRTYQLPALIRPGLTLVISPLIALIRDQVEKLREVPGMTYVAALVSGIDAATQEETLQKAKRGELRLLYVSPERLRDPRFRTYLPDLPLAQLIVDEAHCISTWGHDFRPDFLEVADLLPSALDGSKLPVHALTATATEQVQQEIINRLHMGTGGRNLVTYTGDFVRDNLVYKVYSVQKKIDRDAMAVGIVQQIVRNQEKGGAGIVYVATRRSAVQFARLLRERNIAAHAYHGGMTTPERHQVQELFMQDEIEVVVATSAFGMGVDKPNIRFVLHYDHPASLEAYAQEAGRAGRDGREAYAILLYNLQSQRTLRFIARQGVPQLCVLKEYRDALINAHQDSVNAVLLPDCKLLCDPDEIAQSSHIDVTQARVLLYSFEDAGLISRGPDCTLEATFMLNQEPEEVLNSLSDDKDKCLARALFNQFQVRRDYQVTYHAGTFFRNTRLDPCEIDPLLNHLAENGLIIYRPYARGVSLLPTEGMYDDDRLEAIERRFSDHYQRFESRLESMLEYIHLKTGQNRCRSAYLVNYITGNKDTIPCGKCDLCSPTNEGLPWDPGLRLYGEPLDVDVRFAVLAAVRDHNGWFGRWTIEKMLLGIPQTTFKGETKRLGRSARSSDHFGELEGTGANAEIVGRTIEALIEGGYLQLVEKAFRDGKGAYQAVQISQKGRDALAGGVPLPEFSEEAV